jgi:hypothetical protein
MRNKSHSLTCPGQPTPGLEEGIAVGRVVQVWDSRVGDGAVVSNCGELRFRKVDARLSRNLEGETMPNLSLCSSKPLLCRPSATYGIMLLCLPLGYARLQMHLASWIG